MSDRKISGINFNVFMLAVKRTLELVLSLIIFFHVMKYFNFDFDRISYLLFLWIFSSVYRCTNTFVQSIKWELTGPAIEDLTMYLDHPFFEFFKEMIRVYNYNVPIKGDSWTDARYSDLMDNMMKQFEDLQLDPDRENYMANVANYAAMIRLNEVTQAKEDCKKSIGQDDIK